MINTKCDSCLFGDKCKNQYQCDAYTPINDILGDDYIEEYIEEQRAAFRSEWWVYVSDTLE